MSKVLLADVVQESNEVFFLDVIHVYIEHWRLSLFR